MQYYIKQKVFSFGDKFQVFDKEGNEVLYVQGEVFSWGKKLHIYDKFSNEIMFIKQRLFTFLPKYEVYFGERLVTEIVKKFTFFIPEYTVVEKNWKISGNFLEHEYNITDGNVSIASISKEWLTWGDTYMIDAVNDSDSMLVLTALLVIDCDVDNRSNS